MTGAGRVGGIAVALVSLVVVAACGDSLSVAQCEANAGGNQQALQSLNALLGKHRGSTPAYLARARCHYYLGSYVPAVQDATEVIRREPKQAEAYLVRAKAMKMLGQIPQALQDYTVAIKLQPTAEAYYGRALTYVRDLRGKDREALDDFTAAIQLDPKLVGAYKFRAELYSQYDQFQNALQDSEMVLKLDPTTPDAYCNIGFAHYALGHDAEGRQYLDTCYQKDPDPQTRGYYEAEVQKVLFARQPRSSGGGESVSDARATSPYDREREQQQRTYESLRNSGFKDRAEACRLDSSKC